MLAGTNLHGLRLIIQRLTSLVPRLRRPIEAVPAWPQLHDLHRMRAPRRRLRTTPTTVAISSQAQNNSNKQNRHRQRTGNNRPMPGPCLTKSNVGGRPDAQWDHMAVEGARMAAFPTYPLRCLQVVFPGSIGSALYERREGANGLSSIRRRPCPASPGCRASMRHRSASSR